MFIGGSSATDLTVEWNYKSTEQVGSTLMLNNLGDLIWTYSYAYLNTAANSTAAISVVVRGVLIGSDNFLYSLIFY